MQLGRVDEQAAVALCQARVFPRRHVLRTIG